jgi:hypothetical protein
LCWGFVVVVGGCRNCDLVEAELRTRERELRELRGELYRQEVYNQALQRENQALQSNTCSKPLLEAAAGIVMVKEIALGRQTGGYDNDDCPGDEALQVVVEPLDVDGHAVKTPGDLYVEAIEMSPEGIKVPLSFWQVPWDQLRRTWQNGFLSVGYRVILPWQTWPSQKRLRVVARMTLPDGRVFEAERDVSIRLTPIERRQVLPPALPAGPEILPQPQNAPSGPQSVQPASHAGPSLFRAVQVFRPLPAR